MTIIDMFIEEKEALDSLWFAQQESDMEVHTWLKNN